jgi:hypothetical protein
MSVSKTGGKAASTPPGAMIVYFIRMELLTKPDTMTGNVLAASEAE